MRHHGPARPRDPNGKFLQRHDQKRTPLYNAWGHMINRCTSPTYKGYAHYGGRDITFDPAWGDFLVFAAWASANGYTEGLTLDRRNNDLNYTPDNCRWVTAQVNQNNRGNNVRLTAFGETKTCAEWARDSRCVVSYFTLRERVRLHGWPVEAALTLTTRAGQGLRHRRVA